jgi:hypothetical protein
MNDNSERRLDFLEESRHSHFAVVQTLPHPIQPIHLLALAVLKRSISLVYGFTGLMKAQNFICAVPLIRFQLDNLLRFRAAFMVTDRGRFVVDMLSGKAVRNLTDNRGKKMTDGHLQGALSTEYTWLKDIYKKTSGYVHLSEQHFFNAIEFKQDREGSLLSYVGPEDKLVSADAYSEAIETMILVTHELLQCVGKLSGQRDSD